MKVGSRLLRKYYLFLHDKLTMGNALSLWGCNALLFKTTYTGTSTFRTKIVARTFIRDFMIGASRHYVGYVFWPFKNGNGSDHATNRGGGVAFKFYRTSDVHLHKQFIERMGILKNKNAMIRQCYVTILVKLKNVLKAFKLFGILDCKVGG